LGVVAERPILTSSDEFAGGQVTQRAMWSMMIATAGERCEKPLYIVV